MLSYSQAKELIAEHEAIEKELVELFKAQAELYTKIGCKKAKLKAIEAAFLPEKIEEEKKDEARKKEFMKAVVVDGPKDELPVNNTPEEPKEAVEAPKAVSPYRIKGEK